MRIVIVTNSVWNSQNSVGNSLTNIFNGISDLEIANICCNYGKPDNNFVKYHFQITEKSLIKHMFNHSYPTGRLISSETSYSDTKGKTGSTVRFLKKHKTTLLFWTRTIIWKIGKWKSKELISFLDHFEPELIFIPVYYSRYLNDINQFIIDRYKIPAIGYVTDDVYTLNQFSLSPLYWIDRFTMRPVIRRIINQCQTVFTISDIQKKEYESEFGNKFKILTKCADFDDNYMPPLNHHNSIIKFLYTGNLGVGRADSLSLLSKAIYEVNKSGRKAVLDIYSNTPISAKKKKSLIFHDDCILHDAVSFNKVQQLQSDADVLVHVEGLNWKNRKIVHQSFSTKIVDYLSNRKCIVAIGKIDCASIDYFVQNDSGIVVQNEKEVLQAVKDIIANRELLDEYANKAWLSGKRNHSKTSMQTMLKNTLSNAVKTRGLA